MPAWSCHPAKLSRCCQWSADMIDGKFATATSKLSIVEWEGRQRGKPELGRGYEPGGHLNHGRVRVNGRALAPGDAAAAATVPVPVPTSSTRTPAR
jgi:hypothetical protein